MTYDDLLLDPFALEDALAKDDAVLSARFFYRSALETLTEAADSTEGDHKRLEIAKVLGADQATIDRLNAALNASTAMELIARASLRDAWAKLIQAEAGAIESWLAPHSAGGPRNDSSLPGSRL